MDRDFNLSAEAIIGLHDRLTRDWHEETAEPWASAHSGDWLDAVARQHRANFDLWHIEDEARAPGATDAALAEVKRRIDRTNQLRNDLAEALDRMLLEWLATRALPSASAPLHSESPGLMIDRLSILALKIYHTREETKREDASSHHVDRNLGRLGVLEEQRADLGHCLDNLWHETLSGVRRFKIYRQMKMYNDPSLNPAIYRSGKCEDGS